MAKFLSTLASENSKLESKSVINIYDSIPRHIIADSKNFIELLQHYYEFLNEKNMPINVITNMVKNNDINRVDEEFISQLMSETMVDLPIDSLTSKQIFYKNIVDFYRTKGTIESFRIFFRVFFGDNIEIYYPKDNTFTLGVNRWDATLKVPNFNEQGELLGYKLGGWVNKRGFCSANEYLTDGKYYQPFSYVIKSGLNISKWEYIFNKVCHPSGFVFYGEVAIFFELLDVEENRFKWNLDQPAFTRPSELEQEILIEYLNTSVRDRQTYLYIRKLINILVDDTQFTKTSNVHYHNKYFSQTDIRQYYNLTIDQIDTAPYQIGLVVNKGSYTPPTDMTLTDDGGVLLTDSGDNLVF